jgi:transporter family-2 protein
MNKAIWFLTALLAGAFLPIQAGLNNKMGKALSSPIYASMISLMVGAMAVAFYILLTRQTGNWSGLKTVPGYVWISGGLGAFYVTSVILAFPQIGPALTFGLIVAGQMLISILLDHFNILVAAPHPINVWRILGLALIVGGVVIIRKF